MRISRPFRGAPAVVALFVAACSVVPSLAAPVVAALVGAKAALEADSMELGDMIGWAIQDERIARELCARAMELFGAVRPFANVILAQEAHIRALEELALAHALAVPAESARALEAPESLESAVAKALEREIDAVAMYDRFLRQELPPDARRLFLQLKAASENHLRAFTSSRGRR